MWCYYVSVNGQKVKKADKVKFLGVIIDKNLTWDDQIKHLENKLLATIVLIKRVKKFIPSSHYLKFINPYLYHILPMAYLAGEVYTIPSYKNYSAYKNDA